MFETECEVAVIGGGAAGLAAANEVARLGGKSVIIEREPYLGGILQQCIHTGFGLKRFKRELSGPEYAGLEIEESFDRKVEAFLESSAIDMKEEAGRKTILACSKKRGAMKIHAGALVLATGCRERNRGNIGIAGSRPAGVMTAGLAQRLANLEGCVPGRKVVIVGSGDIGLIMARRMTWIGAKVLAVVELLPYPSGLARNIAQCLDDYGIPLLLSHSITKISGRNRVESVELAPLVNGVPDKSKARTLSCDTVLLSVGLIPENELTKKIGAKLSLATGGPLVDSALQTNIEGVFSCGNSLHVHDLVDNATEESIRCGASAFQSLTQKQGQREIDAIACNNLKYILPSKCRLGEAQRFFARALAPFDSATLSAKLGGTEILKRKLLHVRPSEMLSIDLPAIQETTAQAVEFSLEREERA